MLSKVTEVVEKWTPNFEEAGVPKGWLLAFTDELLKAVDVELEHVCHDNRCGEHMESLISEIK